MSDSAISLSTPLPEVIETPRLRLQIWHPDLAEDLAAAVDNSIEDLRPWMSWIAKEPVPMQDRRDRLARGRATWRNSGDGDYAMLLDDRVVGSCGLHARQGPGVLEIGYWVDSDHTGRGLATEVVAALTEVALDHPDVATVEIRHDRANIASGRVAAKAGYVFGGYANDGVDAPGEEGINCTWRYMTLPGFRVRSEVAADHRAIANVVAAAFASPVEAKLVDDIRNSPEYVPELALVAEIDGDSGPQVVGHVMISGCVLRSADGSETAITMLSPLAVDPEVHGHGIGGALVKAAIDAADKAGEPLVILEGDPRFYGRFGFEPAMDHGLAVNVPDWAPPEAGQVARLKNYRPGLTGTVVYPKAFDGLD